MTTKDPQAFPADLTCGDTDTSAPAQNTANKQPAPKNKTIGKGKTPLAKPSTSKAAKTKIDASLMESDEEVMDLTHDVDIIDGSDYNDEKIFLKITPSMKLKTEERQFMSAMTSYIQDKQTHRKESQILVPDDHISSFVKNVESELRGLPDKSSQVKMKHAIHLAIYNFQMTQMQAVEKNPTECMDLTSDTGVSPPQAKSNVHTSPKQKRKSTKSSTQVLPDPKYGYPGPKPNPKKKVSSNTDTGPSHIESGQIGSQENIDSDDLSAQQTTKAKKKKHMKLRNKPSPCYFLG